MPSIPEELQRALVAAGTSAAPGEAGATRGFAARAAAIEHLELHVLDWLQPLEERASLPAELEALKARAAALCERLAAANERVLQRFRDRIRCGRYTPAGLRRAFARYPNRAGDEATTPPRSPGGYDALDGLVAGLLGGGALSEERAVREPEMVAYQPTPARAILSLIDRANLRPEDVFCDLGSGLGNVVLLVALLSGARARGIEFEPAHCEYAERCARRLNVPGVEFLHADARQAPLGEGTVFFLYTPFRGALLAQVLERLRAEAMERPVRVCTYGPCTAEVANATWLAPAAGTAPGEYEVAVFRNYPFMPSR